MQQAKYLKLTVVLAVSIFFAGIIFESCQDSGTKKDPKLEADIIIPTEFPANLNFPVDSATILEWLNNYDTASITSHAWEIWKGLTSNSGEMYGADSLLIYETWLGPRELAAFCAIDTFKMDMLQNKKFRTPLSIPHQFAHAGLFRNEAVDTQKGFNIYESVAYNPSASIYAVENKIFNASVLKKYYGKAGDRSIPAFPNSGITTKPTYYAGKADANGLIRVPVWPGVPPVAGNLPVDSFGTYVLADINNGQKAGKIPVPINADSPTTAQIAAATVNVNDFIHYTIDAAMAAYLNEVDIDPLSSGDFSAGDLVLLVAMHVGTKEISNWTWQTFFWTPNPAQPLFPSSAFAASLMPKDLNGAASHYAVATAYAMVWPNQPVNGGTNVGVTPIVAFNPYLEAGLGDLSSNIPNRLNSKYRWGIQTNCMSCHAMATITFPYNPNSSTATLPYTADQYISMNDTIFRKYLKLDFAWSIQSNVNQNK